MHLAIDHETLYRYDSPVARSTQYLRLTPRPSDRLRVIEWQLTLPAQAARGLDAYGNVLHVLTLDKPHSEIRLHATGVVETSDAAPSPMRDDSLPPQLFLRDSPLTHADAALQDFAQQHHAAVVANRLAGLGALMQAVGERMPYTPAARMSPPLRPMPLPRRAGCARTTPMSMPPAAACWAYRPATSVATWRPTQSMWPATPG